MSTSYYSYGGYGVVFSLPSELYHAKNLKPSCSHAERIGNKFCPICGTKVHDKTEETWTELYIEFEEFFLSGANTFPKEYVFTQIYETGKYFFGYGANCSEYGDTYKKVTISSSLDNIRANIKEILAQFKIPVSDDDFAIYSILNAS